MMLVKTYLAQSGIHGIGIFADEPIKAGTKIWEFMEGFDTEHDETVLVSTPEPIRSFIRRYSYPHHTQKGKIILDGDHGRFMNHNEKPNTDFRMIHANSGFALKDIARGEELTCNYNEFAPGFVFE